ncbi:uncharacterized protein LOC122503151 [Leptopilina heterotoma]|uniref:uncharacterized protein LOC122503151 n=1 Tax=Leptopilina heterotoma TaxID=63436 RepID=UPI001CA81860|nr:uncharacterized protein LOC122503151 [Leptopilina heterotoma]
MGQRSSSLLRPKISLTWVLRGQQQSANSISTNGTSITQGQEQEGGLSLEIKERPFRNSVKSLRSIKSTKNVKEKEKCKDNNGCFDNREIKHTVLNRIEKDAIEKPIEKERLNGNYIDMTIDNNKLEKQMEVSSVEKEVKEKVKRATSEPTLVPRESTLTSSGREKHKHRRTKRPHKTRSSSRFGYEIADLDSFLTKASIEKPANIPVVLSFPSVLYQTQGGTQDEVALPLGTVVNAVFKNQAWLYVQTPHGQEGYVGYAACLPLGILPQPTHGPCWEDSTDVFPRPLGNMTDTEKLRDTRSECGTRGRSGRMRRSSRDAFSTCGERSVDRLYLRAAANARTKGSRHTLLVIRNDYEGHEVNAISVMKGDVVALISDHVNDWFWVRSRDGREGFIPAVIAGHGFL